MFEQISIILSHPSHPGNIGACARAMKNMGFSQLILINPREYPNHQATSMASGAYDILQHAQVFSSLEEALAPFHYIIGTSARHRTLSWLTLNVREASTNLVKKLTSDPDLRVAILFGTESSGLTNEELQACDSHVFIPANEEYSSLNLAQAVQIITYELRMQLLQTDHASVEKHTKADHMTMERFYDHWAQTLTQLEIFNPDQPRMLMGRLRRLFNKAQLETTEINILRGFLKTVQKLKYDHDVIHESKNNT